MVNCIVIDNQFSKLDLGFGLSIQFLNLMFLKDGRVLQMKKVEKHCIKYFDKKSYLGALHLMANEQA